MQRWNALERQLFGQSLGQGKSEQTICRFRRRVIGDILNRSDSEVRSELLVRRANALRDFSNNGIQIQPMRRFLMKVRNKRRVDARLLIKLDPQQVVLWSGDPRD